VRMPQLATRSVRILAVPLLPAVAAGGSNVLLTTRQAAEYLAVTERALRDNFRRWGLPAHKVGRALRFRVRDTEAYLDRNMA
jgi:excisionase family DNA binding protein